MYLSVGKCRTRNAHPTLVDLGIWKDAKADAAAQVNRGEKAVSALAFPQKCLGGGN